MPPSPPPRDEGSPASERVATGGDEPDVGPASPPSVAHDDAPAVASALLAPASGRWQTTGWKSW